MADRFQMIDGIMRDTHWVCRLEKDTEMIVTDKAFTVRTARKAGRCAGSSTAGPCAHVIQPGERYVEGDLIVDPPFGRGRYCRACADARGMIFGYTIPPHREGG